MSRRCARALVCVVFAACALFASPGFADKKPNNNKGKNSQERRDDERVQNAKGDVQDAQKKLQEEQRDLKEADLVLGKAQARQKLAMKAALDTRKRLEEKHEAALGIDKPLAEQGMAQKAYDDAAAPVLKMLHEKPEYQTAAKAVAAAKSKIETIRKDSSLSESDRAKQVGAATNETLATGKLEREALEADKNVKGLKDKLADVQKRVAGLRERIRMAVENDPELRSVKQELDSAKSEVDKAENRLAKAKTALTNAQNKVRQEQVQLNQAQLQDKQNDGKKKGKK